MNKNQKGFSALELIVVLVFVGLLGFAGWTFVSRKKNKDKQSNQTQTTQNESKGKASDAMVEWMWNENKWVASGNAPACDEPVKFSVAPADLSKATSVLYPGQSRGGDYKPHGGFRFDDSKSGDITVKAITDGYVVSGSRYIEMDEVQYMFTIVNNCGIAYRFDHLATLSDAMQAIADTLPAAKVDDSHTTNFKKPLLLKAGDVVATAVGFKNKNNFSFDLGVYDYRKRNDAAADQAYVSAHQDSISQAAYALCWFDMFSRSDTALIKALPAADSSSGKNSDYCK